MIKQILPLLQKGAHKGQNGRLAIIGGCLEYTGAPFYSSISQLKGGADLAHIFCTRQAAIPIKAYSPEVITHPYLVSINEEEDPEKYTIKEIAFKSAKSVRLVQEWQAALHSFVIGPGLGRDQWIENYLGDIIESFTKSQTIVLDADGLWYLINEYQKQKESSKIFRHTILNEPWNHVLTPNQTEFERLWKCFTPHQLSFSQKDRSAAIEQLLRSQKVTQPQGCIDFIKVNDSNNPIVADAVYLSKTLQGVNLIQKGIVDVITNGKSTYIVTEQSSQKRCGGVGDILSGLTGLYTYWAQKSCSNNQSPDLRAETMLHGCILSSAITRKASFSAFNKHGLSLTAPNVIECIGPTFNSIFNYYSNDQPKL